MTEIDDKQAALEDAERVCKQTPNRITRERVRDARKALAHARISARPHDLHALKGTPFDGKETI